MASEPFVLRVARSDDENSFVLLHISSSGPSALDLTVVATEGAHPYVGNVKQRRVKNLRAKNYHGSDDEWEDIVTSIFQPKPAERATNAETLAGVELVAAVKEGEEITLIIRKNIGGITQRLGTLALEHDESQEIELFDWAGLSSKLAADALNETAHLTTRYRSQEQTIADLNQKLDDLIRAKKDHEEAMLEKFRELLNAKKLKIRDQQRLLDGVKVPPMEDEREEITRKATKPRKAGPSSRGKRKAETAPAVAASDSEPFEEVTNDDEGAAASDRSRQETPEQTDDETEDELEEGATAPNQAPSQGVRPTPNEKTVEDKETKDNAQRDSPPPPRELPFAKKKLQSTPGPKQAIQQGDQGGSEGESDDDEL